MSYACARKDDGVMRYATISGACRAKEVSIKLSHDEPLYACVRLRQVGRAGAPRLGLEANADFFGEDSFTFRANEGTADGGEATVLFGLAFGLRAVPGVAHALQRAAHLGEDRARSGRPRRA